MPLFYNYGDLSNTSVRVYLYHAGIKFDESLGKPSLRNKKNVTDHKEQAMLFQNDSCLYCEKKFNTTFKAERDHIIPMKKETGGMHCWGNILYCCRNCNVEKDKFKGNWKDYLKHKGIESKYNQWIKKHPNGEVESNNRAIECQEIYKELDTYMRNKVLEKLG